MKTLLLAFLIGSSFCLSAQTPKWFLIPGSNKVLCLAEDCENIWAGMTYGLMYFDKVSGEKTYFNQSNSILRFSVYDIAIDEFGIKWLATSEGLYKLDGNDLVFIQPDISGTSDYEIPDFRNIFSDVKNTIWLQDAHNNLYHYHPTTNKCEFNPFITEASEELTAIGKSPGGDIYITTKSQFADVNLYKFENDFHKISFLESITLENDEIGSIFIDRKGNIWLPVEGWFSVGKDEWEVLNGGLIVFDGSDWTQYEPSYFGITTEVGFNNIEEDNQGNLYTPVIGSYLYPYYYLDQLKFNYSKETNSIIQSDEFEQDGYYNLKLIDQENRFYGIHYDEITIGSPNVDTIHCFEMKGEFMLDKNNDVWSMESKTIYHYSNGIVSVQQYEENEEAGLGFPQKLFIDAGLNEWIICENGLDMHDGSTFHPFPVNGMGGEESENLEIVTQSPNGIIWVLGDKHIFKYDQNIWTSYKIPTDGNFISFAIYATDSVVYVGTSDDFCILKDSTWQNFNGTNSIISENFWCRNIVADTTGRIFFSGSNGIYEYAETGIIKISELEVLNMIVDPFTNDVWIANDGLFGKYIASDSVDYNTENLLKYGPFVHMAPDSKGNIFLESENGISIYNETGLVGYTPQFSAAQNFKPGDCVTGKSNDYSDLLIFPNPVNEVINLEFISDIFQTFSISIYDLSGRMIQSGISLSCSPGVVRNSFDISYLNSGMYCLLITSSKKTISTVFTKF